jgi:hypothetical protein
MKGLRSWSAFGLRYSSADICVICGHKIHQFRNLQGMGCQRIDYLVNRLATEYEHLRKVTPAVRGSPRYHIPRRLYSELRLICRPVACSLHL